MTATLETLLAFCNRLEAAGQHGLTPFWLEQAARLYTGTADTLVAQVGRGGIKSGFASRIAINEVLAGDFDVAAGEIHYWVDVSENKTEAQQRLRQYESYLAVLGVPFDRRGDEIVIPELRRGFLVRAFDAGKVAGFRSIGGRADELAKAAPDLEEGRTVVSSMVAMTVTHRRHRPKLLLLSAPVGKTNYHYTRFVEGDQAHQIVVQAATWIANPLVTEDDTRALEPHEPTRLMEYAAIASDAVMGMFFGERSLTAAVDTGRTGADLFSKGSHNIITVDAAFTESGDRFGVAVVTHETGRFDPATELRHPSVAVVHETHAWRADRQPREMATRLKGEVCDRFGTHRAYTDQHEASSWRQLARDAGLHMDAVAWTAGEKIAAMNDDTLSKTQAFKIVRAAMLNQRVSLPDDPLLMGELRSVYSELSPAGNELVRIPRTKNGHGDRISALVMGVSLALLRSASVVPQRWTEADFHREFLEWIARGPTMGAHPVFGWHDPRNDRGLGVTTWPDFRHRYQSHRP